jgi:hypothetical protein
MLSHVRSIAFGLETLVFTRLHSHQFTGPAPADRTRWRGLVSYSDEYDRQRSRRARDDAAEIVKYLFAYLAAYPAPVSEPKCRSYG